MDSLREGKTKLNLEKIGEILKNILLEDSILNYPAEKLAKNIFREIKKPFRKLYAINWSLAAKKIIAGLSQKITILSLACAAVFICMIFSGAFSYNAPENLVIYTPSAYGADEAVSGEAIMPSLKTSENSIFDDTTRPKENSLSEAKCADDTGKNRSSSLCADGEKDQKLIFEMNAETTNLKNKELAKIAASRPKIARNLATNPSHISCKESNNGHPSYSDTKGKHMDEDCCPDPDEWPEPGCIYDAKGLALMLKGPPSKKK
jgi:hypothetical protein